MGSNPGVLRVPWMSVRESILFFEPGHSIVDMGRPEHVLISGQTIEVLLLFSV